MPDRESALQKISALLAKADSTEFEAEADALVAKALAMMAKHSIDEAEARAAGGGRVAGEKPVAEEWEFSPSDANASGKAQLLNVVAEAAGVRFIALANRRGSNTHRIRADGKKAGVASQWCLLAGFRQDIERVQMAYATLLMQALRSAKRDYDERSDGPGKSAYLTAYLMGFAARINIRYAALKETSPRPTPGRADIVLRRDSAVQDLLDGMGLNIKSVASRGGRNWNGREAGFEAGGRADIGQTRMGGSGRKSLNG